jgi:hypothetical protein
MWSSRSLLWPVPPVCLLLLAHFSPALSCSTSSFDAAYQDYPNCGRACLACPDSDYVDDFANNCDYASGECCKSQFHAVIFATWACVQQNCDSSTAQDAFDTYVNYRSTVGVPLAAADVPYVYSDSCEFKSSFFGMGVS